MTSPNAFSERNTLMNWIHLVPVALLVWGATTGCTSPRLTVTDVWSRPAQAGDNGAVYFKVNNGTVHGDTLLGVETDVADSAEMHLSMSDANGVMSMGQQMSVEVPANSTVEFKPGALHVMLLSLQNDLRVGDTFTVTLMLRNAGNVSVSVTVENP